MTAATPMMMPSVVSNDLILFAHSARKAMRKFSKKTTVYTPGRSACSLLASSLTCSDVTHDLAVTQVDLATGVALADPPTFVDFTASLDGEELALEADGTASFLYVVPGAYQLDLIPPAGWTFTTTPTLPLDLTVWSGEAKDVTVTLESLTE